MSDCPNGEDEAKCSNFFCPGMFRCRGENRCIWQKQICDGVFDCPLSHDDELLCSSLTNLCPDKCHCIGQAIDCSGQELTNDKVDTLFSTGNDLKINKAMRSVILSENSLIACPGAITSLTQAFRMNLSHNEISQLISSSSFSPTLRELYLDNNHISTLSGNPFKNLGNLIVLTLHNNRIDSLMDSHFQGLDKLPLLDLSKQKLTDKLGANAFRGLHSAHTINISNNGLNDLSPRAFMNRQGNLGIDVPFVNLRYLDMRNNALKDIEKSVFEDLGPSVALFTDRYKWCCFAVNVRRCEPPSDEFSSCTHLIASRTMHLFVIGMGILSFLGNFIILQQRIKHERETTVSIMVQHLAFSDMLMGAYLLLIAGADNWYKNSYILETDNWLKHPVCKVSGFLFQTSSEMSMLILTIIVGDRMYSMIPGCNAHGMSLKSARSLVALGWTASAILGILPHLNIGYFKTSKTAETAICVVFNLTYGRRIDPWEYYLSVYVVFNLFCVVLMGTGYSLIGKWARQGIEIWNHMLTDDLTDEEKEAELEYRRNEVIITKRVFLVVATNVIVWMPVVMITAFSMLEIYVNKITSAWVMIFVVPLNSVLNPYLFSFVVHPYRSKKDQLLLNWVETEMDDEEDEFAGLGEDDTSAVKADETTDGGGESSGAASSGTGLATVSTSAAESKGVNKGFVAEML